MTKGPGGIQVGRATSDGGRQGHGKYGQGCRHWNPEDKNNHTAIGRSGRPRLARTTPSHHVNQAPLLYNWKERCFHF